MENYIADIRRDVGWGLAPADVRTWLWLIIAESGEGKPPPYVDNALLSHWATDATASATAAATRLSSADGMI